jgi:hypothetical protein
MTGIQIAEAELAVILQKRRKIMNNLKVLENTVLLNLVSLKCVSWGFVKLCAAYKYIGLLV